MLNRERLLQRILSGQTGANIRFSELRNLLIRLGFEERISGSHRIFTMQGISDRINLQPTRGQVKKYQVEQVRKVFEKYGIGKE